MGKQQRAFANPSSPSPLPPLPALRSTAGGPAGGRGAPGPPPPLPPHRPLAPGGRGGGGRRLRVPPPRAPPPPGLLEAIPTLLPRLPQLPVAHGLGGGRGERGLVERRPGARPRRAPLRGRPRKLPGEEEEEEEVGGCGGRGTRSAPRPLRPLPSFSFALFSPTPGRRLGFVRGDGVAPRPPEGGAGHLSPGPELRPRPWRRDPPRLGASRVSRLLGKPRRGRHHEVRGARGGGRRAIVPREPRPRSPRTPPSLSRPGASPRSLVSFSPLPLCPFSFLFLSCNPPQSSYGGGVLFSTLSRFSSNAPLSPRISLPKFNLLLAPSPHQPLQARPGRWGGVRESKRACCWETGIFPSVCKKFRALL